MPSQGELLERIAELQEENDRLKADYELLLTNSSDGYWDWHLLDDFEYMSPRFWEIFGYRPEEKRHHPSEWQALIHPDDLPPVLARFNRHVESKGEVPFDQEVRYRHKKGHWVTVRCKGRVVEWTPEGAPARMVGMHEDISHLIEVRTRAEILYSSTNVGIWDWLNVPENKQYWTPHFYNLLGYEFEEIPPALETFKELLHPDDHERTFALVDEHFAGRAPFNMQYRLRHKSGEYRWFQGAGKALFDEEGRPTRMVGSILDVHDRKTTEEALEELRQRHALALEASDIGVWDWDIVQNSLVWDASMYALYGIREEDFGSAYEAWLAGLHPDDRQAGDDLVRRALEGSAEFNTEFRVIWPSGEQRYMRAIAAVIRDDDGKPLRMIGVNWDITAERERERALQKNSEELHRANQELEQFVYFASHDLQSPLRHVSSFVDLIEDRLGDEMDPEVAKWMQFVKGGTSKMKRLVADLLAYSRAARAKFEKEEVNMEQVVNDTVHVLRSAFDPVEFEVEAKGLPTVVASRTQMEQLVQNLIQNAVKYRRPDVPARIELSASETDEAWSFCVKDNGIGIPESHLRDIFEPFRRFSESSVESTGIGLAICTKIAERHGGQLTVDSVENQGSSFRFSLSKDKAA